MVTTKKTATQKPTAAASKPKKGAKAQKAPVKTWHFRRAYSH